MSTENAGFCSVVSLPASLSPLTKGLFSGANWAVFGLHPNAEITYYTNAAKSIWDDLLLLQATGGNISGGFDKD